MIVYYLKDQLFLKNYIIIGFKYIIKEMLTKKI